jgi:anti-sigma factor RsiW
MSDCDYSYKLNAYHDDELSDEERHELEEHIQACPHCTRELERLQKLSALFQSAPIPDIPEETLARVHQSLQTRQGKGTLRFVELLTAAAVLVLLVGSVLNLRMEPQREIYDSSWEQTALTLQVEVPSTESPELQVTEWLVANLSQENGNE